MKNLYIPKAGEKASLAASLINNCNKLLDVGCGDGIISKLLKRKASEIYGIDKSKENLKKAKKNGLKTKCVDLDNKKIPFKSQFFDMAICLDVLEHVKSPTDVARETFRVLKRGGKFIVSAPNIRFSKYLLSLIAKGRFPKTSDDKNAYDGGHIHYFTFSDLKGILKNTGFKITKEIGIINKKKRGIKGRIAEKILGKKFMREFRSPGILIVARKRN